uniref:Uncharacterized protein n=1 Tax=Vespula pensylvanica TaxID=30213 RepID=A0A834UED0_VESPE|nr:hypothetical protein H0235_002476 [Vespula pensylvanica]
MIYAPSLKRSKAENRGRTSSSVSRCAIALALRKHEEAHRRMTERLVGKVFSSKKRHVAGSFADFTVIKPRKCFSKLHTIAHVRGTTSPFRISLWIQIRLLYSRLCPSATGRLLYPFAKSGEATWKRKIPLSPLVGPMAIESMEFERYF